MRHVLMVAAALALISGASTPAEAQKLDTSGRCRGPGGKLAKMSLCKSGQGQAGGMHHMFMKDASGACHDEKGKPASPALCKR